MTPEPLATHAMMIIIIITRGDIPLGTIASAVGSNPYRTFLIKTTLAFRK
jgi:hypothetical protein